MHPWVVLCGDGGRGWGVRRVAVGFVGGGGGDEGDLREGVGGAFGGLTQFGTATPARVTGLQPLQKVHGGWGGWGVFQKAE